VEVVAVGADESMRVDARWVRCESEDDAKTTANEIWRRGPRVKEW
jgi:hypothetical protein